MSSYSHRNSASDYRTVGRQHSQAKRSAAAQASHREAVMAAEDAYEAAFAAQLAGTGDYAGVKAAREALAAIDPDNRLFY